MFYETADYVQIPADGPPEQRAFFHLGPELSRRFRALPFYIALRHYGADRLGRNVRFNAECARYLAAIVEAEPDLELVAEPQLSICCFRYAAAGVEREAVDRINARIRQQIETEGDFYMSPTDVGGRPVLRVCIENHATRAHHLEALVRRVLEIGGSLRG